MSLPGAGCRPLSEHPAGLGRCGVSPRQPVTPTVPHPTSSGSACCHASLAQGTGPPPSSQRRPVLSGRIERWSVARSAAIAWTSMCRFARSAARHARLNGWPGRAIAPSAAIATTTTMISALGAKNVTGSWRREDLAVVSPRHRQGRGGGAGCHVTTPHPTSAARACCSSPLMAPAGDPHPTAGPVACL